MREKMSGLYFDYKLIDSNQDWKQKWFYVSNHRPQLPKPSMYAPIYHSLWNDKPTMVECTQLPELLKRIVDLKKKGLTAERVAFSFMKHWVQPLMERDHLGYEYTGDDDDSRMAPGGLSNDVIMERLVKMFKDLKPDVPKAVAEFSADRPPKQVSSRGLSLRVLI